MQLTENLTCRRDKCNPEKVGGGVLVDMGSQDMAAASIRVPQEKTQHASQKLWGADASQARDHAALDLEAVQATRRLASRYGYRIAKRLFDIMFSLLVLILLSWVYAVVAIAIKHDSEGPVFFNQERVSKDGKTFKMYKFRSMYVDAEERLKDLQDLNEKDGPVFKIKDDPRITRVGRFIRKTSIDELPQFVNVLKGDMSIVGPRPALPREVRQYTPYQRERLLVKPGITCYWQTRRNRDGISFNEWVGLDLLYIKQCSVLNDLKLIIQTVGVVLTAQGS